MKRDEMYTSEFIDSIQTLKGDDSDQKLFCKLLVSFFAISDYLNIHNGTRYTYNTKKVNDLIQGGEAVKLTEGAIMLEMFFKIMFKVTDKNDGKKEVSMTSAIVDTFTTMMNLATALQSLSKIADIRELDRKENLIYDKMKDEMKKSSSTRNHIVSELVNLTQNSEAIYKKAEKDSMDMDFIKGSMDFLRLLLQFNESN